jgi:hypothetical protein
VGFFEEIFPENEPLKGGFDGGLTNLLITIEFKLGC